jgi:uncharacterized protein
VSLDATPNPETTAIVTEAGGPITAPQPPRLHKVFIGKDGLRAGWSLLIFFALLAIVFITAGVVTRKIHPPDPNAMKPGSEISIKMGILAEALPFIAVLLVTWVMSKIERRPNSVYGFGGSQKLAHFFAGLAWGVVCLSILVFSLWKAGFLVIDRRLLFGGDVLRYGSTWLFGFLLVALLEEYFTRGYVQYTLTRGLAGLYRWGLKTRHSEALGFWTSAVVISFLFGFSHGKNPDESPIGMLSAGLAGIVFCLSLWRTGSLWWAIGFHAAWDWSQSFLYGVADSGLMVQYHLLATHPVGKPILSGGVTGPEGSIFVLAIFGLIVLIIFFTLKPAHYVETPDPHNQLLPARP